ncbi:MAG: two-component regulator propeller domain-containing protein [Bacteroidales bacterium]
MKKVLHYTVLLLIMLITTTEVNAKTHGYNEYYSNRIANAGDYLWIASNRGLIKYEKPTGKCSLISNTDIGLKQNTIILSLSSDKNGNLWIGTEDDEAYMYDGNTTTHYSSISFNVYDWYYIAYNYAFAFDTENNPWAGGFAFYADFKGEKKHKIPSHFVDGGGGNYAVMDMAFDSKDNLWIAIDYGLNIHLLCHKKGEADSGTIILGGAGDNFAATSLSIDRNDNIWFVFTDGIHYYNQQTNSDTHYNFKSYPDIPDALYTACDIDADGNVWFVASQYLLKYDGNKFTSYNCPGFDQARSVLCDGPVVWIYTNNDDVLKFENSTFTRSSIENGLMGITNTEYHGCDFTVTSVGNGDIIISGGTKIEMVNIYNISGTLVSSVKCAGENSVTVIDAAIKNNGIYLIRIQHQKGETVIKYNMDKTGW